MIDRELIQHIEGLEDEELIDMLGVNAGDYRDEVLDFARGEARRRNLAIEDPAPASTSEPPEDEELPGDEYEAAGEQIVCIHCDNPRFDAHSAPLEWAGPGATALVCTQCTRVELFTLPPVRVG